jgi:hypothetical protein
MSEPQLSFKFPDPDTITTVAYQPYWYDDGSNNNCYDGDWYGWVTKAPCSTIEIAEKSLEPYKAFNRPTKIEMVVTTVYKKMIREDIVIETKTMQNTLDFANLATAPLSLTNDVSTFSERLFLAQQLIEEIIKLRAYKNHRGQTRHKFSAREREITKLPYRGQPICVNGEWYDVNVSIQKIWELQAFLLELQKEKR